MPEEQVECSPGWEVRCVEATSKHCSCACGGVNHGKTLKAKLAAWAGEPSTHIGENDEEENEE